MPNKNQCMCHVSRLLSNNLILLLQFVYSAYYIFFCAFTFTFAFKLQSQLLDPHPGRLRKELASVSCCIHEKVFENQRNPKRHSIYFILE